MLDEYIEVMKLIVLRGGHNRAEMVRRLKSRALKDNRLDDANEETIRTSPGGVRQGIAPGA